MAPNLQGKKVWTQQDDEVMYIFTPMEQNHNNKLKNIMLWTSSGEKEKKWANKPGLVCLFKVEWRTPCHNILVEFLNNWKLDFGHNKIKLMMAKKYIIIYRHLLA
jgi:hypothetical protein